MKKNLIITGHDLGLAAAVNDGYRYALTKLPRLFSELSIIPNAPHSEEAVKIAKESGISTNLCFSFTSSMLRSLSDAKSLIDKNGVMKRAATQTWDFSVIDSFAESDVEKEVDAQYQWYLNHFGHKPSALVTQKGEHGDPKILAPLIALAKREKLPMRSPFWQWKANYGAQSLAQSEGIKTTGAVFIAIKDWQGKFGVDLETELETLITDAQKAPGVVELLIFTGFCDKDLMAATSVSWQRGQILNILKRKYYLIERLYEEFNVITYHDLA